MSFRIILDSREKHLITCLEAMKVAINSKTLDLGDIIITNSSENHPVNSEVECAKSKLLKGSDEDKKDSKQSSEGAITLVVERKRFTDLKASISDGRYHEQKSRYLRLPKGTMFYILEDDDNRFEQLDFQQFLGMYVHTILRDQIPVFITRSLEETAKLLIKMKAAVEEFGIDYRDKIPTCGLDSSQIKKKRNSGKDVYLAQLTCFSGINRKKAEAIAELYPSMPDLISHLKDNSFKVRGIGTVLIKTLKDGLFFETENKKKIVFE
jgi:ERCC4-type nuclease